MVEKYIINDISAESYFILTLVEQNKINDLHKYSENFPFTKLIIQNLKRRGYLTPELELTSKSSDLLDVNYKPSQNEEMFEEFWELYPATDKYKSFPRTRALRAAKSKCRKKYMNVLLDEEYTHEDIIKALHYEINQRKKSSTLIDNKFKFMKSSITWLNQEEYAILLDEMEELDVKDVSDIEDTDFTQEFK